MDAQSPESRESILKSGQEKSNLTSALARITGPRNRISLIVVGNASQQPLDQATVNKIQEVTQKSGKNVNVLPLGNEVAVVLTGSLVDATQAADGLLELIPQTPDLVAGVSLFSPGEDNRDYNKVIERAKQALSDARQSSAQGKKISLNIHQSLQGIASNLGPLAQKVSILERK